MAKAREIYKDIVENFKRQLQSGDNPFYTIGQRNALSKKEYKGINRFLLGVQKNIYQSPEWATYKQISKMEGEVKKGEKSSLIFFFEKKKLLQIQDGSKVKKIWLSFDEDISTCQRLKGKTIINSEDSFTLKSYRVFNIEQTTLTSAPLVCDSRLKEEISYSLGLSTQMDSWDFYKEVATFFIEDDDVFLSRLIQEVAASYMSAIAGDKSSKISPQLVEILIEKLDESPYFLFKIGRMADDVVNTALDYAKNHKVWSAV